MKFPTSLPTRMAVVSLCLTTDARGYPRHAGTHVDMGAFEYQLPIFPILIKGSVSNAKMVVTYTQCPGNSTREHLQITHAERHV